MGRFVRFLFLSLCAFSVQAEEVRNIETLAPGQLVDDFSMPSAIGGWGQRLAEQRGKPVMLVWLDRCNQCQEELVRYQLLAESYALDQLVAWFIWAPHKNDVPPKMRLPVLLNDQYWTQSWGFNPRPAVMLINNDGVLDHLILGDLTGHYAETEQTLARWMAERQLQARVESRQ
ncbi:peroxiredoxin family protein [Thalassolituus hydrocarboniclasticus]|uniref:Thioredoxin domain-containing protein n=1 Tax=Thalassolituus hydrocarboniclasticus TaxID=2742796 RepID=A0ABY6A8T8_9GAMM|nr:peroxiredoxin family protein [Thalassolituus hydrocarboniclasticus]UXD87426.1 hypothetical protein HUF19_08265 [Thalassolituus hydrocarboniclasticus]